MPLILVSPYLRKVIAGLYPTAPEDILSDYVTALLRLQDSTDSGLNSKYKDSKTLSDYTVVSAPISVPGKYGTGMRFGNTGYIRSTDWPLARVGTGDFTFEFFVRINSLGAIGDHDYVNFDMYPLQAGMHTDRKFYFEQYGGGWAKMSSTVELKTNGDWVHVAIARASGTTRMFFDGVIVQQNQSYNGVDLSQTADFFVGARAGGSVRTSSGNYDMDEIRVTVGVARYTAAFTPPAAPFSDEFIDTKWHKVAAHLPLTSDLLDAKKNAVTVSGNTFINTANKKFGNGSAYFDGSDDYLTLPASVGQFGTGDFTIEGWVHPETFSTPNSSGAVTLCSQYTGSGLRWILNMNAQGTHFAAQTEGSLSSCTNPKAVTLNAWTHVAVCRVSGVVTVYVNGAPGPAANIATDLSINAPVGVGRFINAALPYWEQFKGFMQDVRISKIARYTKAFSVPARLHPAHTFKSAFALRMVGSANSSVFTDDFGRSVQSGSSPQRPVIANDGRVGQCASFTGTSALVWGGTNEPGEFVIGLSDYSVSGYAFISGHNGAYRTFITTAHNEDNHGFFIGLHPTNRLIAIEGTGGSAWALPEQVSPNAFPVNEWVKFEMTRKAGVTVVKMNDVEQMRWNSPFNLTNRLGWMAAGARIYDGDWRQPFNGKLDDLRFYKF